MSTVTKGRIVMSRNPQEVFNLSAKIYAKHLADGATSELNNLAEGSWKTAGPEAAQGLLMHIKAEALKGEMEKTYRLRDAAFAKAKEINIATAKLLKGKYSKNPKKLSEWGFVVDDTPQPKKVTAAKV